MIRKLLLIACAGGIGTLARYGLSGFIQRLIGGVFPWGTVVVNICGCLLAGLLWAALEERYPIPGDVRAMVFIGFMGAFTTFSTYMLESGNLIQDGEWMRAAGNMLLQNSAGITALFTGLALGKYF